MYQMATRVPTLVDDGSRNPLEPLIKDCAWVAYHGTSSVYEMRIEDEGLHNGALPWTDEGVQSVLDVFRELAWHGTHQGRAILENYTIGHNVALHGNRRVYLAESFARGGLFADFPGGETVMATLWCLDDLHLFATDSSLRATHLDELDAEMRTAEFNVEDVDAFREESVEWRRSQVDKYFRARELTMDQRWLHSKSMELEPLYASFQEIAYQHRPVVYAVQLTPELLVGGNYSTGYGIEVVEAIPSAQLIGKCEPVGLPPTDPKDVRFPHNVATADRDIVNDWRERLAQANGTTE